MIVCPYCQHSNPAGALQCEHCAKMLPNSSGNSAGATKEIAMPTDLFPQEERASSSVSYLTNGAALVMHVGEDAQPIIFPRARETVIGRRDPANQVNPDLDLTPYRALEKGVSRIHAAIRRNDNVYTLIDLGSSNGTRLNGKRLVPNNPGILHDGDEIHLGKLLIRVYLKPRH